MVLYRQETMTHRFVVERSAVHQLDRLSGRAETYRIPDADRENPGLELKKAPLAPTDFESLWSQAEPIAPTQIKRIISGGQTGADRGGLDAAIELGLDHGGHCPRGRKAEDGRIPDRYQLVETKSPSFVVRTKRNAESADATIVFVDGGMSGGSLMTVEHLRELGKPHMVLILQQWSHDEHARRIAAGRLRNWLIDGEFQILNVAGSRETKAPGLQADVKAFMVEVLSPTIDPFEGL